jgi:hypothetical protein
VRRGEAIIVLVLFPNDHCRMNELIIQTELLSSPTGPHSIRAGPYDEYFRMKLLYVENKSAD